LKRLNTKIYIKCKIILINFLIEFKFGVFINLHVISSWIIYERRENSNSTSLSRI